VSARILIVDDDSSIQLTLAALLEDEGFHVDTADGIDEAERLLASAAAFDVVLLDYHLDHDLGTDLLPALRAHSPSANILFLTGQGPGAPIAGVAGWITKGGDAATTLSMIRKYAPPAQP
jgi:DNA-binding response OmpR family regulator